VPWPRGSQPWLSATNVLARVMSKVCCRALVVSAVQIDQAEKKYDKIVSKKYVINNANQKSNPWRTISLKKNCQPADKTFHQALCVTPMIFLWQRPWQMASIPEININKHETVSCKTQITIPLG